MNAEVRVDAVRLIEFSAAVYAGAGMPRADAHLPADTLADLARIARDTGLAAQLPFAADAIRG